VLKTHKAVLVNFWFDSCSFCKAEFPHMQKLYTELKAKGLEVIAIDKGDSAQTITKYMDAKQFTFPVAMGGDDGDPNAAVFDHYGVAGYPTNYLIDSSGKVVFRMTGFMETDLRDALAKLGIK
jgi:thiol-disulfide isomerase/thioredoxin